MKNNRVSFSQSIFLRLERIAKNIFELSGFNNPFMKTLFANLKIILKRKAVHTILNSIDICIAEHCNFSCYSCNRFSHLAEPEFADLSLPENSLKRLSKLSGGNIPNIYFSGGEPLLNPELPEFMRITRFHFPKSRLTLITNGLLLLSQKDLFWRSIREYNIVIAPTKYPQIDWKKIEKKAVEFGCEFDYFDHTKNNKKMSQKFCLDLSGNQNAKNSFNRCTLAANCVTLKNGRIATCSLVFSINHFNNYFNKHIPVADNDSIDIYKSETMQEIVDFVNSPIPLCAYCKSTEWEIVGDWRKSEKTIDEWT